MKTSPPLSLLVLSVLALGLTRTAAAREEAGSLEVSPSSVKLKLGEGVQLRARLGGKTVPVRWTVSGPEGGTVTAAGFYQTPAQAATPATVRVTATAGSPPKTGTALIFIQPVSVSLNTKQATLSTRQTYQFRASVEGTKNRAVRWSVDGGPEHGQITDAGLYTAPARSPGNGTILVRATAAADPARSVTAVVRLSAVRLEVAPKNAAIILGRTLRLKAKVEGGSNKGVEWRIQGDGAGEISSAGLYTPPATMTTPAEVIVEARSVADPSQVATARIRILAVDVFPGKLKGKRNRRGIIRTAGKVVSTVVRTVTRIYLPFDAVDDIVQGPTFRGKSGTQYCPLGGAVQLPAIVANTTDTRLKWSFEGPAVGTLTPDGMYQAPERVETPQAVRIRATSLADPTKSTVFTVAIPPVLIRAEDKTAECLMGGAVQLEATAENTEDAGLTWSVVGGEKFGSVSDGGLYRPPSSLSTPTVVRVRAASSADPSKSAEIQVNIPRVELELSPERTELRPGQSVRLDARVKGCLGNGDVTWKLMPSVGRISPDGVYQAPANGGPNVVQVTATLKADPTKSASATIQVREE